jgi:hypothetical protein
MRSTSSKEGRNLFVAEERFMDRDSLRKRGAEENPLTKTERKNITSQRAINSINGALWGHTSPVVPDHGE